MPFLAMFSLHGPGSVLGFFNAQKLFESNCLKCSAQNLFFLKAILKLNLRKLCGLPSISYRGLASRLLKANAFCRRILRQELLSKKFPTRKTLSGNPFESFSVDWQAVRLRKAFHLNSKNSLRFLFHFVRSNSSVRFRKYCSLQNRICTKSFSAEDAYPFRVV